MLTRVCISTLHMALMLARRRLLLVLSVVHHWYCRLRRSSDCLLSTVSIIVARMPSARFSHRFLLEWLEDEKTNGVAHWVYSCLLLRDSIRKDDSAEVAIFLIKMKKAQSRQDAF